MKRNLIVIACLCSICLAKAQTSEIILERVFEGVLTSKSDLMLGNMLGEYQIPQNENAPYIIGIKKGGEGIGTERYDCNGDGIIDDNDCFIPEIYPDTIFFYDKSDFSLYKTTTIQGSIRWMSSVAKGVYTSDKNLTCFVAQVGNCDDSDAQCGIGIYDENGNKIYSIDAKETSEWGSYDLYVVKTELVKIGENYKLFISLKEKATYVYALPSHSDEHSAVDNTPARQFAKPYPNPTNGNINLPYMLKSKTGHMQIYDAGGHLMETRLISNQYEVLELNTQAYPAGLYFYEVDGTSQSFVVKH